MLCGFRHRSGSFRTCGMGQGSVIKLKGFTEFLFPIFRMTRGAVEGQGQVQAGDLWRINSCRFRGMRPSNARSNGSRRQPSFEKYFSSFKSRDGAKIQISYLLTQRVSSLDFLPFTMLRSIGGLGPLRMPLVNSALRVFVSGV